MGIPSALCKETIQKVWKLAAQIIWLKNHYSFDLNISHCLFPFWSLEVLDWKEKNLSGKTVKDVEMYKERLVGVLPSSFIWVIVDFCCFDLFYNSSCNKLIILQIILVHRIADFVQWDVIIFSLWIAHFVLFTNLFTDLFAPWSFLWIYYILSFPSIHVLILISV